MSTKMHRAYQYIRRQLLGGEIAPGTLVSPGAVAGKLGISHIPVREALRRLESEGLLQHVPRLGAQVRVPSRKDLEEIFDLRHVIEGGAAELAAQRATLQELQQMKDLCQHYGRLVRQAQQGGLDHYGGPLVKEMDDLDLRLHAMIVAAAKCPRLMKMLADLSVLRRVFEHGRDHDVSVDALHRLCRVHNDHTAIVQALAKRDEALARRLICRHVERARELHLEIRDRYPSPRDLMDPDSAEFQELAELTGLTEPLDVPAETPAEGEGQDP